MFRRPPVISQRTSVPRHSVRPSCPRPVAHSFRVFSSKQPPQHTPDIHKELERLGVKPDDINKIDKEQMGSIKKNILKQHEIDSLTNEGYSQPQIDRINRSVINLGSMNDIDDGFGMSPVPRQGLLEIATRNMRPEAAATSKSCKK